MEAKKAYERMQATGSYYDPDTSDDPSTGKITDTSMRIHPDMVKKLLGKGGWNIKQMSQETNRG